MFVTLLTEKGNINLRLILISSYASATYPIVSGLVEVVVHQISIAGLAPIVGIVEPFTSSGSTATRTATKRGPIWGVCSSCRCEIAVAIYIGKIAIVISHTTNALFKYVSAHIHRSIIRGACLAPVCYCSGFDATA